MSRIQSRPNPLPPPGAQLLTAVLLGVGLAGIWALWAVWLSR